MSEQERSCLPRLGSEGGSPPEAQEPLVSDESYTFDDLLREVGGGVGVEPRAELQPDNAAPFLSDADVAMYEAILEQGSNPQVRDLLERDRRSGGELKRRALRSRAPVVMMAPLRPKSELTEAREEARVVAVTGAAPLTEGTVEIPAGTLPAAGASDPLGFPLVAPELLARAITALGEKSRDELFFELETVAGAVHPHAATPMEYMDVRHRIWALNGVMTEQDNAAPCIRPKASFGRLVSPRAMTDVQRLMLNDRQMFDLQFLHRNAMGRPNRKWSRILAAEAFDPVLASMFIKTVGKPEAKVEALGLREDEQMLLGAIRVDKIRKRLERLEAEAACLGDRLRSDIVKGASRIAEGDIALWQQEFVALSIAEGRPGRAAALLRRLYGRARAAAHLANRKADLTRKGVSLAWLS
jgi:hypothetical protein